MNIFYLDSDPVKCASYHCDKHVVKMILESAQLLCTAMFYRGVSWVPYKPTHRNHPCTIWTRKSLANYLYVLSLGKALCFEYTKRYGKWHKSEEVIDWCFDNHGNIDWGKDLTPTPVALAMPDEYKIVGDPIQSYREYYLNDKKDIAEWNYTDKPNWWVG